MCGIKLNCQEISLDYPRNQVPKSLDSAFSVAAHHISINQASIAPIWDELLHCFWESEKIIAVSQTHSSEEQAVLDHTG